MNEYIRGNTWDEHLWKGVEGSKSEQKVSQAQRPYQTKPWLMPQGALELEWPACDIALS